MEARVSDAGDRAGAAAALRAARCAAAVLPSWVGDCVMATPVLRAMRAALPDAKILGFMRRGLDEVLRGTTWLDEMIVCDMKGAAGPLRLAKAMRARGVEAVLLLPNSFRSALAARWSGAKVRVGYARDARGWLLTHTLAPARSDSPIATVAYYAQLASFALGVDSIDTRLELATTQEEEAVAEKLLSDVRRPFVVLNPGANRVDKRWPAERFAAVADQLAASRGLGAVVTGSPGEAEVLQRVVQAAKSPIVNLAQRGLTLGSLKAVLRRASLLITNDTGPRHIAAALGTPVVTLFGPTDHRWTTLNCPHERLLLAEPFLPEELVADKHPKACAIERISVSDVVIAAQSLLSTQSNTHAPSG